MDAPRQEAVPVRVGIIGGGWVATARHIPAFRRDRRTRIVGIADRTASRAAAVARRFGIAVHTTRWPELCGQVDLVSICTPPWTHAAMTIEALSRGCHVLVEKPMATSTDDAVAMQTAAVAAGRHLCVAHNFLFARSVQKALALVAAGRLGSVRTVFAHQWSSPRRRLPTWYEQLPGGLFYDEAPHMVYLIRAFLGDLTVLAASTRSAGAGRADSVSSRFAGRHGEATLEMIFGSPLSEWVMAVIGSEGAVLLDLFRDICVVLGSDHGHRAIDVLRTSLSAMAQHTGGVIASGWRLLGGRLSFGHHRLVRMFVDSVLGFRPLPVSAGDGLAVVRVLDAILQEASRP